MEFLDVGAGGFAQFCRRGKNFAGPLQQLGLPLGDLVNVNLMLFG